MELVDELCLNSGTHLSYFIYLSLSIVAHVSICLIILYYYSFYIMLFFLWRRQFMFILWRIRFSLFIRWSSRPFREPSLILVRDPLILDDARWPAHLPKVSAMIRHDKKCSLSLLVGSTVATGCWLDIQKGLIFHETATPSIISKTISLPIGLYSSFPTLLWSTQFLWQQNSV